MKTPAQSGMTRRELAGAVLAGSVVQAAPQEALPSGPTGELEAAREQNRRAKDALSSVALPVATEPAFHFSP